MNKQLNKLFLLILLICGSIASAQVVKGRVIDESTEEPIEGATIEILGTSFVAITDAQGYFVFENGIPVGDQKLQASAADHYNRNLPIIVDANVPVNLDPLYLRVDYSNQDQTAGIISLTENDLSDDQNAANNFSGLLQSSRDQFLRAAAYDFSATFFRPRGLNSEDGQVLINGLSMNKLFNGRPQWSNWGGVNDLQRNQVFTMGLAPADDSFGGLGGVQSIDMRASSQREGTRISFASSNRSYRGRFMATYNSGLRGNGWAYSITASRRAGEEGYSDGTVYDANSIALSVEKKINENHFLNFTGIYTPNRRGRRAPMTQEIYDLKGRQYNPHWGYLEGTKRNSRVREIEEPILMLNHNWQINDKVKLSTNLGYQFGKIGNTRLDNGGTRQVSIDGQDYYIGGASNPSPDYYQNLPSYFLRNGTDPIDYQNAYVAQQAFINDGQVDWNYLYDANRILREQGGNSLYAIQEDRIDDTQISATSIITADLTDNILFNGGLSYQNLNSDNYARMADLLGGTGYLDIDFFSDDNDQSVQQAQAQSDVRNPNRVVQEGDRYRYNYEINAEVARAFAQAQFKTKKIDYFIAGNVSSTTYQRDGKFENGNFPGAESFGESEKLEFTNYGVKGGLTYKISGQNFIDLNGAHMTQAPSIRSSFVNARQNNLTVPDLESQTVTSADVSYIYRTPIVKARLTGYYTQFTDGTDIGFYFTEDLTGLPSNDGSAFVQEVLTNIDRRNIGAELGIEVQATPTIKLKGAVAIGQNVFTNNPNIALYSDDFEEALTFGDGTTKLEDYHVAGGPERAYQIGFEYRDPDYWWVGATANFFAHGYADVSALRRSDNFQLDFDGLPFTDYDEQEAQTLLKQEQFDDYALVNIVGGKSWKIGDKYIGFFATINNVLDKEYKTGGFEQSRNSNFRSVRDDKSNPIEVFAPRYFFGNGTTYYVNVYLRF